MNILALDMSLSEAGFAHSDGRAGTLSPPRGQNKGMQRVDWFRDQILEATRGVDLVVIEGYAMGTKRQSHSYSIGELGGVIRHTLWSRQTPYVEIPPATLKKLATGRGNAKKEEVLAAAIRRLGYDGHNHNVADALWLLEAAQQIYAEGVALPKAHLEALAKVTWPKLRKAAA